MPMTKHCRPRVHASTPKRRVSAWSASLMVMCASACSSDGVEITNYPMLCEAPVASGSCSGRATPLNRETFRVFAASQQVVSWLPGIRETPLTLEKCAVRDSRNWKCQLPRNEGEVGFSDGEFTETLTPPRSGRETFFYVGGIKWWWYQLVVSRI